MTVTLVFWCYQPYATLLQQAANDGLLGTLQYFDHSPFGPPFAVAANDANFHPVFVQHSAHLIRG